MAERCWAAWLVRKEKGEEPVLEGKRALVSSLTHYALKQLKDKRLKGIKGQIRKSVAQRMYCTLLELYLERWYLQSVWGSFDKLKPFYFWSGSERTYLKLDLLWEAFRNFEDFNRRLVEYSRLCVLNSYTGLVSNSWAFSYMRKWFTEQY